MSRYIDVDATLKMLKHMLYETALNNYPECENFSDACEEIAEHRLATWIELVPTADVIEVVRCKNCKHKEHCSIWMIAFGDIDFCSYGERKEDGRIH